MALMKVKFKVTEATIGSEVSLQLRRTGKKLGKTVMINIILACCVITVQADYSIDGFSQKPEILIENITTTWPYSLAIDFGTNNLYYVDNLRAATMSLTNGEHDYIEGISDVRGLTVDQDTHDLYIGNLDGIYKYKPITNKTELFGAAGQYIWHVYFKEQLYYAEYWSERVFTLNNGQSKQLVDLKSYVYGLVIDREGVVFFRNITGLYSQHRESNNITLYYNDKHVYSLALDRHDNVYFTTKDGIYEAVKHNETVRKVVSIDEPRGIVFDKSNNMIYSTQNKICRLIYKQQIAEENIRDIENQLERKVDIMNTKLYKMVTEQLMEKFESMDRKNNELLHKIDKLTAQVEGIVKMKGMDTKTDKLPSIEADKRLHYGGSSHQTIHIDIN